MPLEERKAREQREKTNFRGQKKPPLFFSISKDREEKER